jgi:hypothetical protein
MVTGTPYPEKRMMSVVVALAHSERGGSAADDVPGGGADTEAKNVERTCTRRPSPSTQTSVGPVVSLAGLERDDVQMGPLMTR